MAVAIGGEGELEVGLAVSGFEAAISFDAAPGFGETVADAAGCVKDFVAVPHKIEEAFFDGCEEAGGTDFDDALDVVADVSAVGEIGGRGFGVQVEQAGFLEVREIGER